MDLSHLPVFVLICGVNPHVQYVFVGCAFVFFVKCQYYLYLLPSVNSRFTWKHLFWGQHEGQYSCLTARSKARKQLKESTQWLDSGESDQGVGLQTDWSKDIALYVNLGFLLWLGSQNRVDGSKRTHRMEATGSNMIGKLLFASEFDTTDAY